MELLAVLAVIAVLCIVLRVSTDLIVIAAAALVGLVIIAMTLLFVYFSVCLIFSRKTKGIFTKIDKSPKNGFRAAFYEVEGNEYPNAFPAEAVLTSKLYRSDKTSTLRLNTRHGFVFDTFARTTCITGLVFSLGLFAGAVIFALRIFG